MRINNLKIISKTIIINKNSSKPSMCFYHCELCHYDCVNRRTFDSHINSKKHKRNVLISKNIPIGPKTYQCPTCDKVYNHYSSLARHKKTCVQEQINTQISDVPQHVQEAIINQWRATNQPSGNPVVSPPAPSQATASIINSANTVNINPQTQINQTINNYIVAPFGKEDVSHIPFERRRDIIDRNLCAYEHLTDELYKNRKNYNILYHDKRRELVKYINENGTATFDFFHKKIKDSVKSTISILEDFFNECESSFSERRIAELYELINESICGDYDDKYYNISKTKLTVVANTQESKENMTELEDQFLPSPFLAKNNPPEPAKITTKSAVPAQT